MSIREEMLAYFDQPDVHARILDYVQSRHLDLESIDEEALLKMMNELQLLEELEKKVKEQHSINQPLREANHSLILTITKGRKFKKLLETQGAVSFYFSLSAFSQKIRSSSYPTADNFSITQKLALNLKTSQLKIDNNENLQLVIVIVSAKGKKILYSLKLVEWRFVMVYGSLSVDLEMAPYCHDGVNEMPCAGVLSITLQISALPKHFFLTEASLNRQLQLEQKMKESSNNKFHAYANSFWNQIKSLHRNLQTRRIPIYAQSEDKIYVALPKFVKPVYGVRGIDSPHHALRFCALIPFSEVQMHRQKFFKRFGSMLTGQGGNVEDHCHLLCSLLMGFGLKAFVCVGTTAKGQHSWVMSEGASSITFWECTKGIKLDYFSHKALLFYKTINAVYNNKEYYANIQLDDSISGTKFNFKDGTLWKKMDDSILSELPQFNKQLSLSFSSINPYTIEQNIESELFKLIGQYRAKQKLSFATDQILSSLLSTALANYQSERVTGQTFCEEEFQTAIKGYIPAKHTFKAFPIQLTTLDAGEIMNELIEQQKSRQILLTKGQSVYFGVRSKIIVFPDNVFAIWISLAIRYYRID